MHKDERAQNFAAPVDMVFAAQGIRARNIPGKIDAGSRVATGPQGVTSSDELRQAVARVMSGDSSPITPLKIDPAANGPSGAVCACGGTAWQALADLAVGRHLGLVVEREQVIFCPACGMLDFPDGGESLRQRLEQWQSLPAEQATWEPSLRYQTERHPRFVQIEVSTRCNLACSYCSHALLPEKLDLDWRRFLSVVDNLDLAEVDVVDFTGLGEATLNPRLEDMIAEIRARGPHLSLRLVSNALAAGPGRWERLIDAGLSSLAFSIDTTDPLRFARQRGGGSLTKALRNAAAVGALRRQRSGAFSLRLKAVLLAQPRVDAEALMRWSFEHGFDMPQFSSLDLRAPATALYAGKDWLKSDVPSEDFDAWSLRFWQDLGGGFDLAPPGPRRWRHPALGDEANNCRWGYDSAYVALGGAMLTCCETMIDLPRTDFATIRDQPMATAWQDDLLWNFRLPMSAGVPPAGCIGCPQLVATGIA